MEQKMLENSYDTNDFYNLHNNEKQTAMKLVTTQILEIKTLSQVYPFGKLFFFKQFRDKVGSTNGANSQTGGFQFNRKTGTIRVSTQLTQNVKKPIENV